MEKQKLNAKETAVIAVLLLVVIGLCVSIFSEKKDTDAPTATETVTEQTTATTTAITTTQTTTHPPVTQDITQTSPSQLSTADIVKLYCDAVNGFKAYTGTISVVKSETVSIEVSNLPTAISSMVNGIISGLAGTKEESYSFQGGASSEGMAITDSVIPKGKNAEINPDGLVAAKSEDLPDGGKRLTLTFIPETAYYDGKSNVSEPTYHKGAMDPIDFSTVSLGPIEVTGISIEYPGATVTATTDSQGRLTSLHCDLPFGGDFNAKAMGTFDVALGMDCSMVTDWVMTYS